MSVYEIQFPAEPATGQIYTAINGVTYVWMGSYWSSAKATEIGQQLYTIDGGLSLDNYVPGRDINLDAGDSAGNI